LVGCNLSLVLIDALYVMSHSYEDWLCVWVGVCV
jgi:hypothetical protein